jgi:4-hydroxybenzoate polyprenyltransferase
MVDMEGYAIVQKCRQKVIPFQLLKVVSDRADDTGHEELHLNLTRVSTILAEEVIAGLEHHLVPPVQSLMARLFNFVKIEHTIFSIPLLLAGAWLGAGGQWPGFRPLLLVMMAGVGARALGMAMNRILDRHIDQLNPRTASRELPSGKLSTGQAWGVAATGLTVYLAACAALGPLCLKLSPIPALALITYSLLKRLSSLCHYGIGVCLALGPLGAFVAVRGTTDVDGATLMLALFTFCWISGFDIIYALQDIKADRETGVHSLPAALGSTGAQWVAALTHLVAAAAAIQLWVLIGAGLASGLALAVTIAALGLAYWSKLPLHVRFFPVSAIAGISGAMIAML